MNYDYQDEDELNNFVDFEKPNDYYKTTNTLPNYKNIMQNNNLKNNIPNNTSMKKNFVKINPIRQRNKELLQQNFQTQENYNYALSNKKENNIQQIQKRFDDMQNDLNNINSIIQKKNSNIFKNNINITNNRTFNPQVNRPNKNKNQILYNPNFNQNNTFPQTKNIKNMAYLNIRGSLIQRIKDYNQTNILKSNMINQIKSYPTMVIKPKSTYQKSSGNTTYYNNSAIGQKVNPNFNGQYMQMNTFDINRYPHEVDKINNNNKNLKYFNYKNNIPQKITGKQNQSNVPILFGIANKIYNPIYKPYTPKNSNRIKGQIFDIEEQESSDNLSEIADDLLQISNVDDNKKFITTNNEYNQNLYNFNNNNQTNYYINQGLNNNQNNYYLNQGTNNNQTNYYINQGQKNNQNELNKNNIVRGSKGKIIKKNIQNNFNEKKDIPKSLSHVQNYNEILNQDIEQNIEKNLINNNKKNNTNDNKMINSEDLKKGENNNTSEDNNQKFFRQNISNLNINNSLIIINNDNQKSTGKEEEKKDVNIPKFTSNTKNSETTLGENNYNSFSRKGGLRIHINLENNLTYKYVKDLPIYQPCEIYNNDNELLEIKKLSMNQEDYMKKIKENNISDLKPCIKDFDIKLIPINKDYKSVEYLDERDIVPELYEGEEEEIQSLQKSLERSIDRPFDKNYRQSLNDYDLVTDPNTSQEKKELYKDDIEEVENDEEEEKDYRHNYKF